MAVVGAAARCGLPPGLLMVALSASPRVGVGAIVYHQQALVVLAYSLGFAATTLGGVNIRQSRERLEQTQLLLAQTQRSHEEQLRSAKLEEQARIARDIHDVLAHTLAGLTIQLEATDALLAKGTDTREIRERVQRAHGLAREGLRETRRAVGALRGAAAPAARPEVALRAGSEQYDDPIEFESGSSDQGGTWQGQRAGEAVVRMIQESLTNVRKHAPGAEVSVAVNVSGEAIDVTVENRALVPVAGASLAATGGGYGLRGMRERAEQLGGTLAAGPTDNGWRVDLHLPLDAPPSAT